MAADERVRKQVILDWLNQMARDYPEMPPEGVVGCFQEEFDFWPEEAAEDVPHHSATPSAFEHGGRTVDEARRRLRELLPDGSTCPVCDQFAKRYRRKVNAGIARALIVMYQAGGTDWIHKPTVLSGLGAAARDESIARYWGLTEEETEIRRDDGGRAGWWRVTRAGEAWIYGESTIPKYALIYNGECLGHEGSRVTIVDALGQKFSYRELMTNV